MRDLYNSIAASFDHTRYNHWKAVKEYILGLQTYNTVLDLGSGNGKYIALRKDLSFTGFDITENLLTIAQTKYPSTDFLHGNATHTLPFRDKSFDYTICVAVIHHFSTPEERKCVVREAIRVSAKGVLFTVWAQGAEQGKKGWDAGEGIGDWWVPWQHGKDKRYYHLFSKEEFLELFSGVVRVFWERENWVGVVRF